MRANKKNVGKYVLRMPYGKHVCMTLEDCLTEVRSATSKTNLRTETFSTKSEDTIKVFEKDDAENKLLAIVSFSKAAEKVYICPDCGKEVARKVNGKCQECHDEYLVLKRKMEAEGYKQDLKKFTVIGCTTGVCCELKKHHNAMAHDGERLKSDFLLGVICGDEIRQNYIEHKRSQGVI